jgi:hypothetical protein
MTRIALVQPDSGARISGGYLYNAQLARHGAWELVSVAQSELVRTVAELRADVLLADSIWLTEQAFAPFLAAAVAGRRVGVVLHALPSSRGRARSSDTR